MLLQGAPHSALGGHAESAVAAVPAALVVAAGPLLGRRLAVDRWRFAAAGGAAYAAAMLLVWAGFRLVFWRFAAEFPASVPIVAVVVTAAATLFVLQWGAATLAFLSVRLYGAVVWLSGVTWTTVYAFSFVGGEAGATFLLALWAFSVGPATFLPLAAVAGVEYVGRRLVAGGIEEVVGR